MLRKKAPLTAQTSILVREIYKNDSQYLKISFKWSVTLHQRFMMEEAQSQARTMKLSFQSFSSHYNEPGSERFFSSPFFTRYHAMSDSEEASTSLAVSVPVGGGYDSEARTPQEESNGDTGRRRGRKRSSEQLQGEALLSAASHNDAATIRDLVQVSSEQAQLHKTIPHGFRFTMAIDKLFHILLDFPLFPPQRCLTRRDFLSPFVLALCAIDGR